MYTCICLQCLRCNTWRIEVPQKNVKNKLEARLYQLCLFFFRQDERAFAKIVVKKSLSSHMFCDRTRKMQSEWRKYTFVSVNYFTFLFQINVTNFHFRLRKTKIRIWLLKWRTESKILSGERSSYVHFATKCTRTEDSSVDITLSLFHAGMVPNCYQIWRLKTTYMTINLSVNLLFRKTAYLLVFPSITTHGLILFISVEGTEKPLRCISSAVFAEFDVRWKRKSFSEKYRTTSAFQMAITQFVIKPVFIEVLLTWMF